MSSYICLIFVMSGSKWTNISSKCDECIQQNMSPWSKSHRNLATHFLIVPTLNIIMLIIYDYHLLFLLAAAARDLTRGLNFVNIVHNFYPPLRNPAYVLPWTWSLKVSQHSLICSEGNETTTLAENLQTFHQISVLKIYIDHKMQLYISTILIN